MNVNPFSKKSAAVAKPVKGVSPLNDIGDVSAVTEMFQRLRQQNAQYDQAIAADAQRWRLGERLARCA